MITAGRPGAAPGDIVERVSLAARAGVSLVQVRERHLEARALFDLVERSVQAVGGTRTRIVVNDRLDVALGAGAHGVHLRSDSLSATRARAMSPPGFLVGRSVHDVAHAVESASAGGLDYLVFGTVFPSASKAGRGAAGLEALASVVEAARLPVLAVGGVGTDSIGPVAATGAAGFAAISLFADAPLDQLGDLIERARRAFRATKAD
jgi:thiamine-phosphate pyrophosphorylase